MYSYGPPHMAEQKQDGQLKHTYSSYVRIQDVVLKTCQRQWTIGRSGERRSGISVLVAQHDDDDDNIYIYIYIYIYIGLANWVECSPMTWETVVQSHVESYQRLRKWYLIPTHHYKLCIKGYMEQTRERSSTLHYTSV